MSYILDALKKLEHEKTKKNRGDRVVNISGTLFENERLKPPVSAGWKIALAVTVAVLVTFAGTWQFFKSGKVRPNSSQHIVTPIPPAPLARVEVAPVQPVPVPDTQAVPEQNKPSKVQTLVRPATPRPVQPQIRQVPVQVVTPADDAAATVPQQELSKRRNDRKRQAAPAVPTIAPPADIKLSGIAYQDERRARRAVVNGFLMQEGGVVSGAVITDILQDRVRFSLAGGRFELSLASAGVPAPGK